MIIYLSLLVCLIGLVVYMVTAQPKLMELGRLMFASGLLVFLLQTGLRSFPFMK